MHIHLIFSNPRWANAENLTLELTATVGPAMSIRPQPHIQSLPLPDNGKTDFAESYS